MPAWFDIKALPPADQEDLTQLDASADRIDRIIEAETMSGVPAERIVLAGFSQGGALAVHAALRSEHRIAGVAILSGWLPTPQAYPDALSEALTATPAALPVFFAHGYSD